MKNVGSLFSGIGGIELGFEQAGFETVWFIEQDRYPQTILKKKFPEAKIYGDIKEVDFKSIQQVDILTGGFPCQDISNAGKRVGIEGDRSSLWKYYLKAISQIRPRIAFIENVSALLGRGLSVVLCDLAQIGYDAEWHSVPASSVGANHQRDRIFILAYSINSADKSNRREEGEKDCLQSISREEGLPRVSERTSNEVPNPHFGRYLERKTEEFSTEGREQTFGESKSSSTEVSNTNEQRWQRRREVQMGFEELWSKGRWNSEPELGRVANGVPNRVDRIKCLGNAVVPQVSEVFAQAIKEVQQNEP